MLAAELVVFGHVVGEEALLGGPHLGNAKRPVGQIERPTEQISRRYETGDRHPFPLDDPGKEACEVGAAAPHWWDKPSKLGSRDGVDHGADQLVRARLA